MERKHSLIESIVAWLVLIVVIIGTIFLCNRRVFRPQYSNPSDTVRAQLEFPLSKVTVRMKESEMRRALKKCEWADEWSLLSLASHNIVLKPKKGRETEYKEIINENGLAEKISNLYSSEGFSWDDATLKFVLPGNSEGVLVPTWLLYKMVEKGLI